MGRKRIEDKEGGYNGDCKNPQMSPRAGISHVWWLSRLHARRYLDDLILKGSGGNAYGLSTATFYIISKGSV